MPIARPPDRPAPRRRPTGRRTRSSHSSGSGGLPRRYKGWAGSVALHAVLLDRPGLLVFRAPVERTGDVRLATGRLAQRCRRGRDVDRRPEYAAAHAGRAARRVRARRRFARLWLSSSSLRSSPRSGFGPPRTPAAAAAQPNDNPGAGDGDGFGLARFGEGGELIRGVAVKVGDPQFTLIWNTDGVDLDLHVLEPGGKEIYWEEPKGKQGGELDVDNTKGFGPENIYWLVESEGPGSEKVKGPGPPGTYKWFVVY